MINDLDASYEEGYNEEQTAKNRRMVALQQRIQQLQAVAPQNAAPTQQDTVQMQPENYSFAKSMGETPRALLSGGLKAVSNTAQALDEIWDAAADLWEPLHQVKSVIGENVPFSKQSDMQLPTMAPIETNTGRMMESAAQFLTGFIPATKTLKAAGVGTRFLSALQNPGVRGLAAGAAADYFTTDPTEKHLSDLVQELVPEIKLPVINYLTSQEDDTTFDSRMKNVIEGAGLGLVGETLVKGIKALKGSIRPDNPLVDAVSHQKRLDESVAQMEFKRQEEKKVSEVFQQGNFWTKTPVEIADNVMERLKKGEDFSKVKDVINLDYLEDGDQLRNVINAFSDHMPELMERNGFKATHTWENIKSEANEYLQKNGLEISEDMRKKAGAIKDLDTYVYAVKELHAKASQDLDEVVKVINATGGSPQDLARFRQRLLVQAEIQSMVKGTSNVIGKALNAHKMMHDGKMVPAELLETSIHASGGEKALRDAARRIANITDPIERNKLVEKAATSRGLGAIKYYWINSILSAPTTWMVNATTNIATALHSIAETTTAATKNAITGEGDITFRSVGDQLTGMWAGLADSLRLSGEVGKAAGRFLVDGDTAVLKETLSDKRNVGSAYHALFTKNSAIDPTNDASVFDQAMEVAKAGKYGTMGKVLKEAVGVPGRILMATDEIFKTIHYRGYLNMEANIMGRKLGKEGADLISYVDDFIRNPLTAVHEDAMRFARYGTFQSDLGKAGKYLQGITREVPVAGFIMPFIRTPTNILKYTVHHSPLMSYPGLRKLSTQISEDIAAGGVRKELAEAKYYTGSALFAVAGLMASQGMLTGGAAEEYRNGTADLIGKQKYSVKIGDQYYSFSRLDPFGMFFGFVADMHDLLGKMDQQEWEDTAGSLLLIFSQNFASKTYLKGLIDFTNGIVNSHGTIDMANKWARSFASGFIPSFMATTNRIHFDTQVKEISSFMDALKARVYGFVPGFNSTTVAPKRDLITGDVVNQNEAVLGGYLPIYTQKVKDDPLLNELYNIGFKPTDLPDTIIHQEGGMKPAVKLDGKEKDRLHQLYTKEVKINGMNLQDYLRDLIQSDYYQSLPANGPEEYGTRTRSALIHKTINRFRNVAHNQLIDEGGTVRTKLSNRLMELIAQGP